METRLGGHRILIIDDDADFGTSVASFLEANGYQVSQARSGREGLRQALVEHPDLILMDVMMGERTEGLFAVQQLRRMPELSGVPVFIVTSLYASVPGFRIEPSAQWLAHDAFFAKPLDLPFLLDAIRTRLELPAAAPAGGGEA
jgi:DNA-binding response OmpR family regulator